MARQVASGEDEKHRKQGAQASPTAPVKTGRTRRPYEGPTNPETAPRVLPGDSWDSSSPVTLTQAAPPNNGHLQARLWHKEQKAGAEPRPWPELTSSWGGGWR